MTFEVPNPKIERLLKDIGRKLHGQMPKGWGFTLFLFSYGEKGSLFYLSSARRKDMLKTLMEFLEKQLSDETAETAGPAEPEKPS